MGRRVFGKTLRNLRDADPESHAEITRAFAAWDNVDVVHQASKISIHGNSFFRNCPLQPSQILQRRCEQLGVKLLFAPQFQRLRRYGSGCDLLVAATASTVPPERNTRSNSCQPSTSARYQYIWMEQTGVSWSDVDLRENEAGVFAAHSYKFNETTSTFIIECDRDTWDAAGFASMGDDETRAYLEKVFELDLAGQPLLSQTIPNGSISS